MGTISVVSTPIGNLGDISVRAMETLFTADIVAAEDTRRTLQLLQTLKERYGERFNLGETRPERLVAYYDEVEAKRLPELVEELTSGKHIALVSDAGTPMVSDPGYRLVREAIKRGHTVYAVPGPSALLAALTVSGLPPDRFTFLGYLPEKQSRRTALLSEIAAQSASAKELSPTFICYAAPHKLASTLEDMKVAFGDVPIVIARELTKVHEEVFRGSITEAHARFAEPKGEFVVLFSLR